VYFWNLLHRPKRTGVRLRMDGEMAGKNFEPTEAVDHVTWTTSSLETSETQENEVQIRLKFVMPSTHL